MGFLFHCSFMYCWRMLPFAGIVFRDKGFGWSGFGLDYGFQCFQESVQAYQGVLFVRLGDIAESLNLSFGFLSIHKYTSPIQYCFKLPLD
jgi:hypothetical protein